MMMLECFPLEFDEYISINEEKKNKEEIDA